MIQRSNSTRETCSPFSSARSNRDQEVKLKSLSLESKPRKLDSDILPIPLPKDSNRDSQSSKTDMSRNLSSSQFSQSKISGLNVGSSSSHSTVNPKFDSRITPKQKPSSLDTSTFFFHPLGGSRLNSEFTDSSSVPTPSLNGKLDQDSGKSNVFSFNPNGSSKWSDSSTIPTPSLRVPSAPKTDEGPKSSPKWSGSGIVPTPSLDSRKPSMNSDRKQMNSKPKRRSISPLPTYLLSDVFKEAKAIGKRFSTPPPSRKGSSSAAAAASRSHSEMSPMKHLSLLKATEKSRTKKDGPWAAKYFDYVGGRVAALETLDEWMVELSKLYLGLRFASGAHSRLYHGMYKDQPVAVKIIRQPDDDENGDMAARLEKQFFREVTFLSHLSHRNVIKVSFCLVYVFNPILYRI